MSLTRHSLCILAAVIFFVIALLAVLWPFHDARVWPAAIAAGLGCGFLGLLP